jgi:hypothetical protein
LVPIFKMKIHCLSPFQHHPSTKILFASGGRAQNINSTETR